MFDHSSAKHNKLRRMGSSILLKYHIIYVCWNAFLRLMEINYLQCFSCPICRDTPDTVIIDVITLGSMKELLLNMYQQTALSANISRSQGVCTEVTPQLC